MRNHVVRSSLAAVLALAIAFGMYGDPSVAQTAQPPKRIGVLSGFDCDSSLASKERLAELGWVEGRTIIFDCVGGIPAKPGELAVRAAELVARKPDVIVSSSVNIVVMTR